MVVDDVRGHFQDAVFQTIVPRNVKLSEAPSFGQSILIYAPDSPGAAAYQGVAEELVKRI
jgi:chromosome partitioning protein